MGLMDKVKAQAEQAVAKGKQGMSQGQSKLDAMQAKKHGDALLRDLGAAYYAQLRSGGSADTVTAAVAAVDEHSATHGAVDTAPAATTSDGDTGESGASYNLDDI